MMRYLPTVWPRKNIEGKYTACRVRGRCGCECRCRVLACRVQGAATILRVRPRFYLPTIDASGRGELDEDEARHLTRVLRLGAGADIDVFDGRGGMFRARVDEVGTRRASWCRCWSPRRRRRNRHFTITLVDERPQGRQDGRRRARRGDDGRRRRCSRSSRRASK